MVVSVYLIDFFPAFQYGYFFLSLKVWGSCIGWGDWCMCSIYLPKIDFWLLQSFHISNSLSPHHHYPTTSRIFQSCGLDITIRRVCRRQEMRVQSLGGEDSLEGAWQPAPVFLPGESHGQRRLPGCIRSTGLQRVGHDWTDLAPAHTRDVRGFPWEVLFPETSAGKAGQEGSLGNGQMDASGVGHGVSKDLEGEHVPRWCSASQSGEEEQLPLEEGPQACRDVVQTWEASGPVLQAVRFPEDRVHSLSSRWLLTCRSSPAVNQSEQMPLDLWLWRTMSKDHCPVKFLEPKSQDLSLAGPHQGSGRAGGTLVNCLHGDVFSLK